MLAIFKDAMSERKEDGIAFPSGGPDNYINFADMTKI